MVKQFSLPKVRKTRLQADFVTNNQILVVKRIKIRPPSYSDHPPPFRLLDFINFSDSSLPPRLLRPPVYSGPKCKYQEATRNVWVRHLQQSNLDRRRFTIFLVVPIKRDSTWSNKIVQILRGTVHNLVQLSEAAIQRCS